MATLSSRSPAPLLRRSVIAFAALLLGATWLGTDEPASAADGERTPFSSCNSSPRVNCVVDGDTFWYAGEKIRIADINTPEISQPECPHEARLGAAASQRLLVLLNDGPFTLKADGRDKDRYGRLLRTVERDGESLGNVLVREGLAEEWQGRRSGWC